MGLRWRRILVGGLFVLLLPVALIAVLVMAGPDDREAAARLAETLSGWPDLVFGVAAAGVVGWFVARPVTYRRVLHGVLVGVVAAALDVVILIVAAASFEWVHLLSIASVVAAGAAGGAVAGRGRPTASARHGA